MHRFARPLALLLLALWLPAMLHCELEAAEVHFLTHTDHDGPAHHSDAGSGDAHHPTVRATFAASLSLLKIPPPDGTWTVVLPELTALRGDEVEPGLSTPRHGPPREWRVAWQFLTRAALPARAPDSQLT